MIETTLALSVAVGITIAAAVIGGFCYGINEINDWYNARKYKQREKLNEKSPMVKRFQYLAGITDSYEDEKGNLRRRFNRIRSSCYYSTDYNHRFNLRYM